MAVREESVDLFGFYDVRELEASCMIISVNGVWTAGRIGAALRQYA
jgi:Holliday junction resolvasome RuvABC DNA-binding subunit